MRHTTTNPLGRSAAEIEKGDRPVLWLSEREVRRCIDPDDLLDALDRGFRALSRGEVQAPHRPMLSVPGKGFSLAMPAWAQGSHLTVKVVNVFEDNLALDLPNHLALVALFDSDTGMPVCVMDGTYITAIRTAASAVLSVRALARPEARIATVIGAGVQGRQHVELLPRVRDFDEIRIISLYPDDARALARHHPRAVAVEDARAAVVDADVVCLASHAYQPVIEAGWIRLGTHVSSVGYAPPAGELPTALLARGRVFVETLEALEPPPVGCAELAGLGAGDVALLGAVLEGGVPGRVSAEDITVYKAMGIAMEDMVAANLAYAEAQRRGVGQTVMV